MRLLLDTNAFIRWMAGNPVPRSVERALNRPGTECHVSIITGWEIVMKPQLGFRSSDLEAAIVRIGAALLPIKFKHLNELSGLPYFEEHRDPFDRLLIAQALSEELTMVTSDRRFASYKRLRLLWD